MHEFESPEKLQPKTKQLETNTKQILQSFNISKTRLQQNWWKNRLKKLDFLALDSAAMLKWAGDEPWNQDVSERYYYTMSKMMDQKVGVRY